MVVALELPCEGEATGSRGTPFVVSEIACITSLEFGEFDKDAFLLRTREGGGKARNPLLGALLLFSSISGLRRRHGSRPKGRSILLRASRPGHRGIMDHPEELTHGHRRGAGT